MSTSSGRTRKVAGIAAAMVATSGLVAACGSPEPSQPAASPATSTITTSTPGAGGQSPGAVPADTISPGTTSPATTAPGSTAPAAGPSATAAPASPSPSPTASGSAGLALCRTAKLLITVDNSQAGGSAGSAYYPLNFTNASSTACEMYGFPGVSFTAAPTGAGRQIGTAAKRSTTFPKVAIRLAPGASAHAWLKVTVSGNYPASSCQPVTAHWLRVYPPGETVPGYVGHDFSACSSTSLSLLTVLPVRSGKALAGITP